MHNSLKVCLVGLREAIMLQRVAITISAYVHLQPGHSGHWPALLVPRLPRQASIVLVHDNLVQLLSRKRQASHYDI